MTNKISFLLAMICSLLVLSTCSPKQSKLKEVVIGAVLPLTGPIASYGRNAQAGIDLAIAEENSKDSIKVRVIYEDDAGEATNAVSAAQKLISMNNVPLIVGEASSGFSLAIAPICNQHEVVLFSPISSAAELTSKGGPFFFRVCPSDAFQAKILAQWLVDDKIKNVSLLYVNSDWGLSLKDEFTLDYISSGGNIVAVEACREGDRDFRSYLAKLKRDEIQALVAFTPPKEGGPMVRQARELGFTVPLYGGDFWGTPEFKETAGEAANGVLFTFPASPSGLKYDEFVEKYKKAYGKDPDVYAAYSYDLMHIVFRSLRAGATTGVKLRDYLRSMDTYVGITGPTRFDQHGDVITKTFDKKTIINSKNVIVK
jgi:branched-chain amino acid transport system substrate-binding protein